MAADVLQAPPGDAGFEEDARAALARHTYEDKALAALAASASPLAGLSVLAEAKPEAARAAAEEQRRLREGERGQLQRTGTLGWLTLGDADYLAHKDIEAVPGTFTMELVPGALGALQALEGAGYEPVLLSDAQPWLASLAANTLRAAGLVGPRGAVQERNLLFCGGRGSKVRVAYHLGGFAAALDDDWEALKDLATEGLAPTLLLFNPVGTRA